MKSRTAQIIENENRVCANNYSPLAVVLSRGEGAFVWDVDGNRYVDMMSAYSAVSLGHAHPRLLSVLQSQAHTLTLTSRAFYTENLGPFLHKLCQVSHMDKALPMNTGAEAIETALKAARRWGYEKKGIPDNCAEIIVARNNFHGRTISIISFSSDDSYRHHFGPLTQGFVEIPFGDSEALARAITPNTCAFLVEPIQGEAGIVVPPIGWLKRSRAICRENNVLFILDEVQSGLGRTGAWFDFLHESIVPDAVVVGKALGGGILPVSALLAKNAVMEVFVPGSHGSTFGGNPLAARIGLEVLTILEQEKLIEKSARLGKILFDRLSSISSPFIKSVRGRGLWVGVEIASVPARIVCEKLMQKGVLSKDTHNTVVRFAPPLVIEEAVLLWACDQFEKTLLDMRQLL